MENFTNCVNFKFGVYVVYLLCKEDYSDGLVVALNKYAKLLRDCYGDEIALKEFVFHVSISLFMAIRVSVNID